MERSSKRSGALAARRRRCRETALCSGARHAVAGRGVPRARRPLLARGLQDPYPRHALASEGV